MKYKPTVLPAAYREAGRKQRKQDEPGPASCFPPPYRAGGRAGRQETENREAGKGTERMNREQTDRLIDAIERVSAGRTGGAAAVPMGLEAVCMALCGVGMPGRDDSVAAGLHDVAGAIRELAEAQEAAR